MGTLLEFLIDHPVDGITEEFILSERLKDWKFKITAMSKKQFDEYQDAAVKIKRHKKLEFDNGNFNRLIILNHTVYPDFKSADFIAKAGCKTPEELLNKVLLAGEVAELAGRISSLSGFDKDTEELEIEAKNS